MSVEIVVHLEVFSGRFVEQYPTAATEHFDIAGVVNGKTEQYLISESFFTADPRNKTIYFFTSLCGGALRVRKIPTNKKIGCFCVFPTRKNTPVF